MNKFINTALYAFGFYKFKKSINGVHLGCGPNYINNFINIDANYKEKCDIIGRIDRLQFKEESVDIIYNSHVLEHIPKDRIRKTLSRWHRVLKPDGKLYICVPNLENLCKLYLNNLKDEYNLEEWEKICTISNVIYGGQNNKYDFHHEGYSFSTIKYWMKEIGFKDVRLVDVESLAFTESSDSSSYIMDGIPISLNIEATK